MAKYKSIDEVIRSLSKKRDVKINTSNKEVNIVKQDDTYANQDLGNGSWGKIDYLVNYCGYRVYFYDASDFQKLK